MSYGPEDCDSNIAITDHILWDIITNGKLKTPNWDPGISLRIFMEAIIKARFGGNEEHQEDAKEAVETTI
ncbi:hypothetical protein Tco_1194290 [Tanacetum coccineum]